MNKLFIGDTPEQLKNGAFGKKYDSGKPLYNLIPAHAEAEFVDVLTFGANKYGPDNWQNVSDLKNRYMSALLRHVSAYRMGETNDQESGKHHLAHAMCCLSFILEKDLTETDAIIFALQTPKEAPSASDSEWLPEVGEDNEKLRERLVSLMTDGYSDTKKETYMAAGWSDIADKLINSGMIKTEVAA